MPIEYSTKAEIVKVLIRISSQLETIIQQNRIILDKMDGKQSKQSGVDVCSICEHRYWHDPECGSCNAKNRFKYFAKMDGGAEDV